MRALIHCLVACRQIDRSLRSISPSTTKECKFRFERRAAPSSEPKSLSAGLVAHAATSARERITVGETFDVEFSTASTGSGRKLIRLTPWHLSQYRVIVTRSDFVDERLGGDPSHLPAGCSGVSGGLPCGPFLPSERPLGDVERIVNAMPEATSASVARRARLVEHGPIRDYLNCRNYRAIT